MAFAKSPLAAAADEVQRLLNLGLIYSLTLKGSGLPVNHFHTLEKAMRAKTRKTRVVLTRNLLIDKVNTDGKDTSG